MKKSRNEDKWHVYIYISFILFIVIYIYNFTNTLFTLYLLIRTKIIKKNVKFQKEENIS
jgi:hypothetical protein